MILAGGKAYETARQNEILDGLEARLNVTLAGSGLDPEILIDAVDALGKQVAAGSFDRQIEALPVDGAMEYKALAVRLLSRDFLEFKRRTELGADFCTDRVTQPPVGLPRLRVLARPLGVLLHIAAGNADGLPAFSLAEGLLTGNINLLKLPQADNGLTLEIVQALLDIEPRLSDYIYVFDTPSSDVGAIKRLADLSDGIVVWGGEAAVSAVRRFAHPGTRLIEWGHRLSFAYLSGEPSDRELQDLAAHIVTTRQLLCSSCQVIYLDTENSVDLRAFCDRFYPVLEATAAERMPATTGAVAELTLRSYTDKLEAVLDGAAAHPWRSTLCSLIPKEDSSLELSPMFGNVLVKALPRGELLPVLRKSKPYLQTAGLSCPPEEREELIGLLSKAGITRITTLGAMSRSFPGEAHDGDYPLRRYLRMVDVELPDDVRDVCGKAYRIRKLLGHGKGGYSYLAEGDGGWVVLKQIHHEPCDYYAFGNKIEAERHDYERLLAAGIRIPRMLAIDTETERIVKEYVEGPTVFDLVKNGESVVPYLAQVREMAALAKNAGLNIDFFPTNFVVQDGQIWYIDYECNAYMDEWNFENWGVKYWSRTPEFEAYLQNR